MCFHCSGLTKRHLALKAISFWRERVEVAFGPKDNKPIQVAPLLERPLTSDIVPASEELGLATRCEKTGAASETPVNAIATKSTLKKVRIGLTLRREEVRKHFI